MLPPLRWLHSGMKTKAPLKTKLKAARRSLTVWFSAAVPVVLAVAEALQEQIPVLSGVLSGWSLVALAVGVSAIVAILRVRNESGE